ncbi:hypothetical protein GCM10009557_50070 [Virgisporangium ochraceum]
MPEQPQPRPRLTRRTILAATASASAALGAAGATLLQTGPAAIAHNDRLGVEPLT